MSKSKATLSSLAEQLNQLASTTSEIHTILMGKPPEQVGLVMEVDRLKQAEGKRTKHLYALWTALVGTVVGRHWV